MSQELRNLEIRESFNFNPGATRRVIEIERLRVRQSLGKGLSECNGDKTSD